jgi:hypothetical protein
MKRIFILLGVLCILNLTAYAEPFAPNPLKLSAPPAVQYSFDGSAFSLPVNVSGLPATVYFMVFTRGQAGSISRLRNGYLGWHYVNKIDTCLYISPLNQFDPGSHSITWNGRDENGNPVPPGSYTYYLWGIDNINTRIQVTNSINFQPWGFMTLTTTNETGQPLTNPILTQGGEYRNDRTNPVARKISRWVIGDDPTDASLLQTTTALQWDTCGGIAYLPRDHDMFFFTGLVGGGGTKVTRKFQWVPGGQSILQTDWGSNGEYRYSGTWKSNWNYGDGCVSDGADYLFLTYYDLMNGTESKLIYLNINDGTEIKRLDLTDWWVNSDDGARGGQTCGGPTELWMQNGTLGLGSHSSCLNQVIDPYYTDAADVVLWSNSNGDLIGDHNWERFPIGSAGPWVCNDYNVGPYKYNFTMDSNGFSAFPCYDNGTVSASSFGLYGPDGSGIAYIPLAGETEYQKFGVLFVDSGSAYDGLLCTSNVGSTGSIDTTVFWVGHSTIKGTISSSGPLIWVSSPAGGEVWGAGSVHRIVWQANEVDRVNIDYSTDGGSTWTAIAGNIPAFPSTFDWTPQGIQSDRCIVRVSSAVDPSIHGVSYAPFTITPPFVQVDSPNGGEVWETGITKSITWSFLGIDRVSIEYSLDNGSTWNMISNNAAASARSISWKVPDTVSENCLVRISDASNASLSDVSDGVFKIMASFILVLSPKGGEEWGAGQTQQITWTASSVVSFVRIDISSDNGTSWSTVIDRVSASGGSYFWKVPNLPSPRCIVRVSDVGDTALKDQSDAVFSITSSPLISYTRTDGLASNDINALAVEENGTLWFGSRDNGVSRFDGVSWKTYNKSNSGIVSNDFLWIEPDREGKLWFGSTWDGVSCFDGSIWTNYSQVRNIRCIVVDFNNVKWFGEYTNGLSAFNGSQWTRYTTANGLRSNNCETAMLDNDNSIWVGYRFGSGVSNFDGKSWRHYSTSDGLINNEVRAMAVDKNGVRWFGTSGGISSFDGQKWTNYPKSSTMNYNTVEAVAVDNNNVKWFGTYGNGALSFDGNVWKLYNTQNSGICSNDIIRVLVDKKNTVWFASRTNGVSCYVNNTGPYVQVASPRGGELWGAGSIHEITWLSKDVDRVRIEYSLDGGTSWGPVAENVDASSKFYSWTLPQTKSFSCKVRLTDVSDENHTDTSNGFFTISPPFIKVTVPNGGERWATGITHVITWVSLDIARLKIEYSTDGGSTWNMVNTVDAASGSYSWTVPPVESEQCLVRLSDASTAERTDVGDGVFIIMKPYITVTAPNGGETLVTGQEQVITWVMDGVGKVRIEYSVDGGISWNKIASSVSASAGRYSWWPLAVRSTLCLLRVSDMAFEDTFDMSDDTFFITTPHVSVSESIPIVFTVFQNTPNPFNPSTEIRFAIPRTGQVSVDVYNISGQKVTTLLDSERSAGVHTVRWDASGMSAGLYFCRVRGCGEQRTIKMMLVK